jgi:hypothetical protein
MMAVAKSLHHTGLIGVEPADWKDLFIPLVHGEPGN